MIYKYPVPSLVPCTEWSIQLPRNHKFLDCQLQFNHPVLWFNVIPPDVTNPVFFMWLYTGQEIPIWSDCTKYLKTIQHPDGLVYHLFMRD